MRGGCAGVRGEEGDVQRVVVFAYYAYAGY